MAKKKAQSSPDNGEAAVTTKPHKAVRPARGRTPAFDAPSSSDDSPDDGATNANVTSKARPITINNADYQWLRVLIHGQLLLTNHFRISAMQDIINKQLGLPTPKQVRNPRQEFLEATHLCRGTYRLEDFETNLYGVPATAFKKAIAAAMYRYGNAKNIVDTIGLLFVHGAYDGLVPLYSHIPPEDAKSPASWRACLPTLRHDAVPAKTKGGSAAIVFRPEFRDWSAVLDIRFCPPFLSMDTTVNALSYAGQCVGVGTWRVERRGDHGTFDIDMDAGITRLPPGYHPVTIPRPAEIQLRFE